MELPNLSAGQRIGMLGMKAFRAAHPDTWLEEGTPTQGGDFGFDVSMWLEQLGHVLGRFSVQLKAEVNPQLSKGPDPFYTIQLTPAQCNLYLQDGQPVIAVHAALAGESSKDAVLRYVWITDEIQRRLAGRPMFDESDPAEMTFRVPAGNVLDSDLDISELVKSHWNVNRLVGPLRTPRGSAALSTVSGMSAAALDQIGRAPGGRLDAWLTRADITSDAPWFTPEKGSIAEDLRKLAEHISRGDTAQADDVIADLTPRCVDAAEDLHAEYCFQLGRRASMDTLTAEALEYYEQALVLVPDSERYLASAIEANYCKSRDPSAIPAYLLERAQQSSNDAVVFQLVRLAALAGDTSRIAELMPLLKGNNRPKAEVLVHLIEGEWKEAVSKAEAGLASAECDAASKCFLSVLRSRAVLHTLLAGREHVPPGGNVGFNVTEARELYRVTEDALRRAQHMGWPANSEMLLDPVTAVMLTFGPDPALLELVKDYAAKRPRVPDAQEAVARLAAISDDASLSIAALERLPESWPDRVERLVLCCSESRADAKAISLAREHLLSRPHSRLGDAAVLAALGSAVRSGAVGDEKRLRDYLSDSEDAGIRCLLEFLSALWLNGLDMENALERLVQAALHQKDDGLLADNAMLHLRPHRSLDLPRIIAVAEAIQSRRHLDEYESTKYAGALLEQGALQEVVSFTDRASTIHPRSETLGIIRALALDRMGQSAAASHVLGRFSDTSRLDLLQARSQLHLRAGQLDQAVELVQQALSQCNDREQRFGLLQLLIKLQSASDPAAHRDAVWRIGEIADQTNEAEEGCFLCHFALATMGESDVDVGRVSKFKDRVRAYAERFPDSKHFRVGTFPESASLDDLLSRIRSMSGMSDADLRAHQRAALLGERAGSQVPFGFRPRHFAPYAQDIFHLFGITVAGVARGESSRLFLSPRSSDTERLLPAPILDLVTVIALVELNVFHRVFEIWTAIAIPQVSLEHLAELQLSALHGATSERLQLVVAAIRERHAQIIQPRSHGPEPFPVGESNTIVSEITAGRYRYLTVDRAAIAMTAPRHVPWSLWDLIDLLCTSKVLGMSEAAHLRLRVASWNVSATLLEVGDVVLGVRGEPGALDDPARPLYRAVVGFLRDAPDWMPMSSVIAELARDPSDENALRRFTAAVFREGLMMGEMKVGKGLPPVRWTAFAAALVAHTLKTLDPSPLPAMRRAWSALKDSYRTHDQLNEGWDALYLELGQQLARVLDKIVKQAGVQAMVLEEELCRLVFSLAEPGTSERERLESAYFDATRAINR